LCHIVLKVARGFIDRFANVSERRKVYARLDAVLLRNTPDERAVSDVAFIKRYVPINGGAVSA